MAAIGALLVSSVCNALDISYICQIPGQETFLLGSKKWDNTMVLGQNGHITGTTLLSIVPDKIDPNYLIYALEQPKPGSGSYSIFGGPETHFRNLYHYAKVNVQHPGQDSSILVESSSGTKATYKLVCSKKFPKIISRE